MMRIILALTLILCLMATGDTSAVPNETPHDTKVSLLKDCDKATASISTKQAKVIFDLKKGVFVDCREWREYRSGHIPGAIHIPRGMLEFEIAQHVPDRTSLVVIYCRSGQRACLGAWTLKQMGYENAVNLESGWQGWNRAWYSVE